MITIEPRKEQEEVLRVQVVTRGVARTSLDTEKTLENKIRKVSPVPPQFEATQQKQFLHDAMESLKDAPVFHKDPLIPKQCEPQPEDQVNTFLKCCIKILNDPHVSKRLT
jgi:hypothetical protein